MSEVVTSAVNRTLLAGDDFKSLIEEKMDDLEDALQRKTAETCFHEFVSMPYYYIFMEKLFGGDNKMNKYIKYDLGLSAKIVQRIYRFCLNVGSREGIEAKDLEVFCNPVNIETWLRLHEAYLGDVAESIGKSTHWVQEMIHKYVMPHTRCYEVSPPGFVRMLRTISQPFDLQQYEPGKATRMTKFANERASIIKAQVLSNWKLSLGYNDYCRLEKSRKEAEEELRAYVIGALLTAFERVLDGEKKPRSSKTAMGGLSLEDDYEHMNEGKGDKEGDGLLSGDLEDWEDLKGKATSKGEEKTASIGEK